MDKEFDSYTYADLCEALEHCKTNSDMEFELYQKLVRICDDDIKKLYEDLDTDVVDPNTGKLLGWNPTFLDEYAAPMDNLSRIYMEKGEYAKALSLLEQALPIYRTLEIYNTNYTYQRRNAIEAMIECLEKLGKENLAILYGYELKHLQRDVLDKREKSNTYH